MQPLQYKDYALLQGFDYFSLQTKVEDYLRQGWILYGNPIINQYGNIYQAVIR